MHISSATHGKEAGDCSHVNHYVHRNFASVARIQQVSENINICKHVHHHSDHLHAHTKKHTEETTNGVSASCSEGGSNLSSSYQQIYNH